MQTEGLEQSGNRTSDENLHDTNSTISIKTENGGEDAGESSNLVASNVTENAYRNERSESDISESDKSNGNTETNENPNVDATEDEMFKGDTQTGETDETSDSSSANETMDLMREILLRLPVRSVSRFKCVCKSWLSIISDPQFGNSHYDLAAAPSHRLILRSKCYSLEVQSIDTDAPPDTCSAAMYLLLPLQSPPPKPNDYDNYDGLPNRAKILGS